MRKPGFALRAVTSMTPLRLSFAGGGTDCAPYYTEHGGAVVSTPIDKYVYVMVKRHSPLFNEGYRLSYSKTEHVDRLDDIENDIARECLRLVPVDPPLFINTAADLPALSGLGSSSSFAVGLLYALHLLKGEDVSAGQLAEEACEIEINRLKRPIGKQDQYAAAFGGLNYIAFQPDGRVQLDPLWLPDGGIERLFNSSMLFWTGMQRDANTVLEKQATRLSDAHSEYAKLAELAATCRDDLLSGLAGPAHFGALLDAGWQIKRDLAQGITTAQIDRWYDQAVAAGALGGKIAGAGGGGFLFLVVPPDLQDSVRAALPDMIDVPFGYDPRGARILSVVDD
jgi:D-glycero-alpha-D-manno-heptose-7-phosphate kinase